MIDKTDTGSTLTRRTYKVKNPAITFFCPLCRIERGMIYSANLSPMNYAQIITISTILVALFFPLMGIKSLFLVFVVWAIFEAVKKVLFRKEIPCPHCGFDATWYKKDVRVAQRLVKNFWDLQNGTNLAENSGNKSSNATEVKTSSTKK